jgi:hypothetical protein
LLNKFILLRCVCAFGGGDNESRYLMRLPGPERLMIVQVCKLFKKPFHVQQERTRGRKGFLEKIPFYEIFLKILFFLLKMAF